MIEKVYDGRGRGKTDRGVRQTQEGQGRSMVERRDRTDMGRGGGNGQGKGRTCKRFNTSWGKKFRPEGGIEPLRIPTTTGLKPAPHTSEAHPGNVANDFPDI